MENPFDAGYYHSEELRTFGFAEVGDDVMIARNCTIIGLPNISIGHNVRIDGGTTIAAARGRCSIGSFIHIGGGCHLACVSDVTLEDFTGLSQGVKLYSASDDYSGRSLTNPTIPPEFQTIHSAPIRLGRHVIIGSGSVILPGVHIGEGSSVGALSLVGKSLDPWGIYSGIPVRRVKDRRKDLLASEAQLLQSRGL
ncbi:acyltransferase [Pacificoceanicola onchidii]|uniref:acyltransferase n=1 Tax=Pacificoceanicola onchidii TaxID=2562685 RepID=UPI00197D5D9A|nr:acyltransferase [Pacificoceanicola onchidii]